MVTPFCRSCGLGCSAPAARPVVVGIEDWAIKRGHRYGTVFVGLEARQPIEVLGRRVTTMVADWFRQHRTGAVRSGGDLL